MIETIMGEGGIKVVPDFCLKGLRELCDEHEPAELNDLEHYITKQGYGSLLQRPSHSSSEEDA